MKKYNYDRLKDAYRQFSAAETEYRRPALMMTGRTNGKRKKY